MKITQLKFININESVKGLLTQNMLKMQIHLVAFLGSERRFAEARQFQNKSNSLIIALNKAMDEETISSIRTQFVELYDKYKGEM